MRVKLRKRADAIFQPPNAKSIGNCKTIVQRNVRNFNGDDTMQEGACLPLFVFLSKAILTASFET